MSGGIYLIGNDGGLVEMTEQEYEKEDHLQELLASYPNLLAGDQMSSGEPRRWLLISRELGVPSEEEGSDRWSVDHLFLDQDAIPTVVEVKRSSNTGIRRQVVGQMLDYAANAVVYWPVERLRARFEEKYEDPEQLIGFLEDSDADSDDFWQKVKTNLQAGRVRLVFVADKIPAELRRVVEFLNQQMDPAEVLAVEIKQYMGEGMKTLVPRVIGQTVEAQDKKTGGVTRRARNWDVTSFFEELEFQAPGAVVPARAVLEWMKNSENSIEWGKGSKYGTFSAMLEHRGSTHHWLEVGTNGRLYIQLGYPQSPTILSEESKREEFLLRLEEVPGIALSTQTKKNKWPSISLTTLEEDSAFNQLLGVLDWFVQEVKAT